MPKQYFYSKHVLKYLWERKGSLLLLLLFVFLGTLWFWRGPLGGRGGLPVFGKIEIPVTPFFQEDPQWSQQLLAGSSETIGSSGCALSSAAMVIHFYGAEVDPKKLNEYLIKNGGYEGDTWIRWEVAATFPPSLAEKKYEGLPSYALIDWNLFQGNPVIVRIRRPTGKTHFLLLIGKRGFDYLVLDPAPKGYGGIYPFAELGTPIEALRFYKKK